VSTVDGIYHGAGVARRTKLLWMDEEKRPICLQTAASRVLVAQVASRFAVNANLILKWLRDLRSGPKAARAPGLPEGPRFLPVEIVEGTRGPPLPLRTGSKSNWRAGT
jgi:transposase